jgi:hypothetical protein
LRLSDRRLNKLRIYAVTHDKTMTHVIEELINGLPLESLGDWSTYVKIAIHLSADPVGYSVIALAKRGVSLAVRSTASRGIAKGRDVNPVELSSISLPLPEAQMTLITLRCRSRVSIVLAYL